MAKQIRVLHCPHLVGGNPQTLARAERELGLASYSIVFQQNYLQYPVDEVLLPAGGNRAQFEIKRWQLFRRALWDYDIIHFNFGETILPKAPFHGEQQLSWRQRLYWLYARLLELKDLPLLKRAGKGIVITYQGDDARQGDYVRANFPINIADEVDAGYYTAESDQRKRQRIASVAAYADRIYALNPDLLHVLPSRAQFLPYSHIDLREWQPIATSNSDRPPVLLHAPSHRGAKGTRFVLDAVERLRGEGVPFEFILVEKLANAEARKLYEQADLLVDQLLAGWYGGLAVELMALGKPVLCFIRQDDLKLIPSGMCQALPIINVTPGTIYTVLREYLTVRKHELPVIGQRSRIYVDNWHNPLKIAGQLKREYEAIVADKRPRKKI